RRPWFRFYPGDWLRHPGLRSCSVAARGLWIEVMAIMAQAEPYGHLRAGSKPLVPADLARIVGAREKEIQRWLGELEVAGVFIRKTGGEIYSARMVRDEADFVLSRENGRKGGNPNLQPREERRGDNPPDNRAHAPRV